MKKNSISRFTVIIITALFMFSTTNVFAGMHVQPVKTAVKQPVKGEAFMAYVQVNLSNMADTPYLSFSVPAELAYAQASNLLGHQSGLFNVHITFVDEDGETVEEDDYYIDNREYSDAIKYD